MRNYVLIVLLAVFFASCKPYQSTVMRDGQITYERFRESQKSFNSKEGTLAYIDQGQGPVIVLLHGIPTSGWLYRKMIDPIVDSGYRVIVPDMLGFGSSASPKGYEMYSEALHGQRLLELMNHLKVDNWTHVMHDAGGLWTWELLKQDPKRIENLIMLNTIVYEEGFQPPIRFRKGIMARTAMWSYRNGITTNMMLRKLFSSGMMENSLNKTDIEGYKRPMLEGKTNGMYYFFSQTCNELPNYQSVLQALEIPTAIIWGRNDSFLKLEPQREAIVKDLNILTENVHQIEAKHFIQEEKPEEIVAMILAFLKD